MRVEIVRGDLGRALAIVFRVHLCHQLRPITHYGVVVQNEQLLELCLRRERFERLVEVSP